MSIAWLEDASFGVIPILPTEGGDRFLLVQHRAGHWGFPKGHAHPTETAQEAACRELTEETGISQYRLLSSPPLVEQYSFREGTQMIRKTVTYYLAQVSDDRVKIQLEEIRSYAWLFADQVLERLTYDTTRMLFRQAIATLAQMS